MKNLVCKFFKKLLEPYLYWICFYERKKKSPWGEYSHGAIGIFEYIGEENLSSLEIRGIAEKHKIDLLEILSLRRQRMWW